MSRQIKSQGPLTLLTETGNMTLTPAGSLSLKGHAIGTDVQAYSAKLTDIAGLTPVSGDVLEWDGSNFIATSHAEEKTTAQTPLSVVSGEVRLALNSSHLEENNNALQLIDGAVDTSQLADDAIIAGKIADGAVVASAIGDGAVVEAKLGLGAVTTSKLASDAVTSAAIADNAVTTSAINDASVTSAKLATGLSLSNGVTHSSGNADADGQVYALHQTTADATPVNVTMVTLSAGETQVFEVLACARDDTAEESAGYKAEFVCQRPGTGNATMLSASNVSIVHEDDSSWALDFACSTSGVVSASLTGDVSNTTRWSLMVKAARASN